ncbi:UNVERIFIED_CONTAM: hypothetical protein K2H54_054418 [Gekko kuhli]
MQRCCVLLSSGNTVSIAKNRRATNTGANGFWKAKAWHQGRNENLTRLLKSVHTSNPGGDVPFKLKKNIEEHDLIRASSAAFCWDGSYPPPPSYHSTEQNLNLSPA